MREKLYAFWLSDIPGIGCRKISALMKIFGNPENIFQASEKALSQVEALTDTDREAMIKSRKQEKIKYRYEKLERSGIRYTYQGQPEYPERLVSLSDAPYGLFYKGSLPAEAQKTVAVVGSRNASHPARALAANFGRELAENGIAVVSGLARGVDIMAQRGVLTVAAGRTYGVLGCGLDMCYPPEHMESFVQMQEMGGVISEFAPGTPPLARNFPMRNRIISGLSDGVLVLEAGSRSGSLITAHQALEQGRDLFVVPGNPWEKAYQGSNELIKTGAALVTCTRDILDALGIFLDEDISEKKKKNQVLLESTEKIVYSYLGFEPIHLSHIARMSGVPVQKAIEALISMELKGIVEDVGSHYYAIVL